MGFRPGCKAKVWDIADKEWYATVKISTERFDQKVNKYVQDFSAFARFINDAHTKAVNELKIGDRILIKDAEVTTRYDKEKKKEYINYCVFDFDIIRQEKSLVNPDNTISYLDLGNVNLEFDPEGDGVLPFM